jgi:uncharacterized protein
MPLAQPGYRRRLMEDNLKLHLEAFGAVEVRGPKWCGKTWLSLSQANSVTNLDDPATRGSVELDPRLALQGDAPHLVDEWQEVPAVWDAARRAIDEQGDAHGMFLLTGSSSPNMDKVSHSGAGRIARLRMEPMTLAEQGLSTGEASIEGLFASRDLPPAASSLDLAGLSSCICRGGWPAALDKPEKLQGVIAGQYLEAFYDSIAAQDGLDPVHMRRTLQALARNDGHAASIETIARDSARGEKTTSTDRADTRRYLSCLEQNYLLRNLGGWDAPVKSRARTRMRPKRYLVDPSLTASLLGYDAERLLWDRQLLGILFESLCIRDLSAYLAASTSLRQPSLFHYRDAYGLEVDAIIELAQGSWAALEVKLDIAKADDAAANLLRLRDKVAANPMAQNREPAFLGVITANAPYFFRRPDGVYVIPVGCLGR